MENYSHYVYFYNKPKRKMNKNIEKDFEWVSVERFWKSMWTQTKYCLETQRKDLTKKGEGHQQKLK